VTLTPFQTTVLLALVRIGRPATVREVAVEAGIYSLGDVNRTLTELWRLGVVADDGGFVRPLDLGAWSLVEVAS
jgi:predicted transcriptional regulator